MLKFLGKKIGMTHMHSSDGNFIPLTVVKIYDNVILNYQKNNNLDFNQIKIAFDQGKKEKNISKTVSSIFKNSNLPVYSKIKEFKIYKDHRRNPFSPELGDKINKVSIGDKLDHKDFFSIGNLVNISSVSIGKGFAGVMKRHNFAGLEASHGVSVSHRSHGSTGQNQDPGKVFKGKKMAGHMGQKQVTVKNLEIIDSYDNIIMIKGCVAGHKNTDLLISSL